MSPNHEETIVAPATANGVGGVGIVRISGALSSKIALQMLGINPRHRYAEYCPFMNMSGEIIDQGIALFFKGPHSFTGEDILELQAHGGPVVIDQLVKIASQNGARLARPGEFLERAFLNNKIDLVQAEAIHDLIHASTEAAARGAARSMQGAFSKVMNEFSEGLTQLRMFIEASIDFPEEELELLQEGQVHKQLEELILDVKKIETEARQGALLSQGLRVVIAGKPNVGKSSLLNVLVGYEAAIVTDIAGTTRDVLKEEIAIDGLSLQLVDTAGIHLAKDAIEQEGIRRAKKEIELADHLIIVADGSVADGTEEKPSNIQTLFSELPDLEACLQKGISITVLYNKIDVLSLPAKIEHDKNHTFIYCSAKTGEGISLVRQHLKERIGFSAHEGSFSARRRHIDAIHRALEHLLLGQQQLIIGNKLELLAEELKQAQLALDEVTGKLSSDDLLGKIFQEFCIGK